MPNPRYEVTYAITPVLSARRAPKNSTTVDGVILAIEPMALI